MIITALVCCPAGKNPLRGSLPDTYPAASPSAVPFFRRRVAAMPATARPISARPPGGSEAKRIELRMQDGVKEFDAFGSRS